MGAINALSQTIDLLSKNPRILLVPLIIAFIMVPITAYQAQKLHFEYSFEDNNVSQEELKAILRDMAATFARTMLIIGSIMALLNAVAQYYLVKSALTILKGEKPLTADLIKAGLKKAVPIAILNVFVGALIVGVALIPHAYLIKLILSAEGPTIPGSAMDLFFLLWIISLFLELFILPASMMVVPAYIVENSPLKGLKAYAVAFRNMPSTLGFGVLLGIIMLVFMVPYFMTAFAIHQNAGFSTYLTRQLIQAPFLALSNAIGTVGGLMLYLDFKGNRKEE
ncbi:hypothetical protein PAP_07860 [Palaeococcus pacificus DY20341]|uniref:Uncharacterized protein n=1 Tax=Palaeococcus pacificus DY20341 TaxID=1343739 RepID=A0A075LV05_9EURY|nr:hypothetical protein [Palaeococcus pacificus]AIF69961.1 hypothetical protein PAP_07860 [Palaeococcus pacificus DY20341]